MNDTDFISASGGYEYTPIMHQDHYTYLDSMYPDIPNDTDFVSATGSPVAHNKNYLDSMYPDIPNDTNEFLVNHGGYEYTPLRIDKQETPDGNVFTMKIDDGMRPWGHSDLEYLANMNKETNQNGFWKYNEDKALKELEEYLASTYHSHYTSEESKTQTLDLIGSIGDGEAFSRSMQSNISPGLVRRKESQNLTS